MAPSQGEGELMLCVIELALNKEKGTELSAVWKDIADEEKRRNGEHRVN